MKIEYKNTIDLRGFDHIRLEMEAEEKQVAELEVILYPLRIARPEFYPKTTVRRMVSIDGKQSITVPLRQFDTPKMADAGLRYISAVEVLVKGKCEITIHKLEFCHKHQLEARFLQASLAGEAGELLKYDLYLHNEKQLSREITAGQMIYGRESMPVCVEGSRKPCTFTLAAGEEREISVSVRIPEHIPQGGMEEARFLVTVNGCEDAGQELSVFTTRKRAHPYLVHTREGFAGVKQKIALYEPARTLFERDYLQAAKDWQVPEASTNESFVFQAYSQNQLYACAISYVLTGEKVYGEKAALYLNRLCDEEKGYLTTKYSYFQFIASKEEYSSGDFKEHRACSAGWVQEAEFFIKAAMAYDILYDTDLLSRQEHEKITQVFRSYMTFQDWLLTDGDGNNFQLAEATAGFLCALVLQEEHWIRRFLYGKNGLTDLLSSVFMEDGMYFEMATSYMKLAEEILSQAVIAAENYGIPLKYFQVQGCYDETVLLAPWANRKKWAEDGKPFLGMSFERFQNNTDPYRNFKKYYDALLHFMTPDGIMFSSNDSNEHMFGDAFDRGYYLYGEKRYLSVVTEKKRDLLYGDFSLCLKDYRHYPESKEAYLSSGVGYGILRQEEGKHKVQAVLKYGPHGGYHGHFDRMSLVSVISNNKIFHNMEYAWYGYTSFLFKMWVQTSMAHNMVTVDQRMQEPTKGECILFEAGKEYQAMCVQTTARWCDPPYGGQTPYLDKFPEEKCQKEGRYILPPPVVREQGAIGEYSEPVFQRRLLLMVKGILVVLDYIKGERVHSFDCLYHPMGVYQLYGEKSELKPVKHTRRFGTDPFGAAQFITNCAWYESEDTVHLEFHYMQEEKEKRQLLEYAESSRLFCAYPKKKTVMIGKYPESSDTFLEEEITEQGSCKEKQGKKTVAFETRGTEAAFVTAVEVESELLEDVICEDFEKVVLMWKDGTQNVFGITGMKKESNQVMVTLL